MHARPIRTALQNGIALLLWGSEYNFFFICSYIKVLSDDIHFSAKYKNLDFWRAWECTAHARVSYRDIYIFSSSFKTVRDIFIIYIVLKNICSCLKKAYQAPDSIDNKYFKKSNEKNILLSCNAQFFHFYDFIYLLQKNGWR